MEKAIENFPEQLRFKPEIKNKNSLAKAKSFAVCGMGGSSLSAGLLKSQNPSLDLIIHRNYGLPADFKNRLIIINSYSGNTEEALDSFNLATRKKLPVACISAGGKLLELAERRKKPYIKMPDTGIESRSALGFSATSLLKIMRKEKTLSDIFNSAKNIKPKNLKKRGQSLAKKLNNYIPIIYSSEKNKAIAYNWKIRLNETGKIPSFYNVFPELNHNEIEGFKSLKNFRFVFLADKADHPRIVLRMNILKKTLKKRGFSIDALELKGGNFWEKAFSFILLADWTAYFIAKQNNLDPVETKIITEFKKNLKIFQ